MLSRLIFGLAACLLILGTLSPAQAGDPLTIIAFGDSLTAGNNLSRQEAFPARLERHLRDSGYMDVSVINAGVSGETTTGGLRRAPSIITQNPDAIILALGANDVLKRRNLGHIWQNLDAIMDLISLRNIPVLLIGMEAPADYSASYANGFREIYQGVASKYNALLYPFFLEGVFTRAKGGDPDLLLKDGLHPNAKGADLIARKILPYARQLAARAYKKSGKRP